MHFDVDFRGVVQRVEAGEPEALGRVALVLDGES